MPADLTDLFARLGAHTDKISLGTPRAARQRGRRRRRNQLTATSLVLFLLAGVALAGAWRLGRHGEPPAQPTPKPTVSFTPLTPVTGANGAFGPVPAAGQFGIASVFGNRAYVAARSADGRLRLDAIGLTSGQPVFPSVDLGQWDPFGGLYAGREAVVVTAVRGTGAAFESEWFTIDPDTGAVRWQMPFSGTSYWYDSAVAVESREDRAVRGLDWRTGAELWRIPYDAGIAPTFVQVEAPPLTTGPSTPANSSIDPTDHRLLRIDADGTLHMINAATGEEQYTRPHLGPVVTDPNRRPKYFAYGHKLYWVSVDQKAIAYDLDRTDPPAEVFAATPGRDIEYVTPCGEERVCVHVRSQVGDAADLVVLDEASHRELWRAVVAGAARSQAVGDRILAGYGQLFDLAGHELSAPAGTLLRGHGVWLAPGSVLTLSMAQPGPGFSSPLDIAGMYTVDGSTIPLGRTPKTNGACDLNQQFLVCPTEDGFRAWQFATA